MGSYRLLSLAVFLTLLLAILKLQGNIACGWIAVFAPAIVYVGLWVLIIAVSLLFLYSGTSPVDKKR